MRDMMNAPPTKKTRKSVSSSACQDLTPTARRVTATFPPSRHAPEQESDVLGVDVRVDHLRAPHVIQGATGHADLHAEDGSAPVSADARRDVVAIGDLPGKGTAPEHQPGMRAREKPHRERPRFALHRRAAPLALDDFDARRRDATRPTERRRRSGPEDARAG